jgi:hypothetical protein
MLQYYYKTSKNTKIDIRAKRMHKTRRFYIYTYESRQLIAKYLKPNLHYEICHFPFFQIHLHFE